jgi:hypothetical protein
MITGALWIVAEVGVAKLSAKGLSAETKLSLPDEH